jgi:hypothetical protein
MKFLNPVYLHWLWLALIPLALWLFRRKAKRVQVSTLLFFRTLAREHQESAWLRRLKRIASLLLTLLVILMAVLALARPFREGGGETPTSLVILLDRSASMAATDAKGRTRLEEAKDQLRDRLNALPENVVTSLVVYDSSAEVLQSRSTNRRELLRQIQQTTVRPVEDDPEAALLVARRLAALDAPAEIWHTSDRAAEAGANTSPENESTTSAATAPGPDESLPDPARVRFLNVALETPLNAGITGFQIRPAPLARNRFEAFVEITASSANAGPVESTLEARLDGRPVQLRQMTLAPGGSNRLILPLEGGKGQRLEMEVRTAGDCLTWDNVAVAPLPETKPLVVAWFTESPDPFVELALSSMLAEDRIQILKGGVKDWPMKEKPDVYVFENWVPPAWPPDRPVLVLNPPSNSGPILARKLASGVPYEAVRPVQPDHPVLYRVVSGRVAVTQTTVLNVSDTLETLWMAGNEPVLAAGESGGQRVVVTAFTPGRSEQLALLASFPLLIGNALYWCAENNDTLASLKPGRPGDLVPVAPGLVRWRAWLDGRFADLSEEVPGGWLELRHIGLFEDASGRALPSLLISARETHVPAAAAAPAAAGDVAASSPTSEKWARGGNWSTSLLWLVLGVLLVESWLFHRQAVY